MRPKVFVPIRKDAAFECLERIRDRNDRSLWISFLASLQKFDLFIDTDCEAILGAVEECEDLRATVYLRPSELKGDGITTNDLVAHFLERYRIQHEVVAQIHITHPFLRESTLLEAWSSLSMNSPHDSVVSCNRDRARFWSRDETGFFPLNHNPMSLRRTSQLPPFYRENSAFYIFSAARFRSLGNRLGLNPEFFEIAAPETIGIVSEDGWNEFASIRDALAPWSFCF